jgi:hypothetical protein
LLWIIPFLWGLLVNSILNDKAAKKRNGKFTDNWMNLAGGDDGSSF